MPLSMMNNEVTITVVLTGQPVPGSHLICKGYCAAVHAGRPQACCSPKAPLLLCNVALKGSLHSSHAGSIALAGPHIEQRKGFRIKRKGESNTLHPWGTPTGLHLGDWQRLAPGHGKTFREGLRLRTGPDGTS